MRKVRLSGLGIGNLAMLVDTIIERRDSVNNVEKMNTYIEGMKVCGITMEVTGVEGKQLLIEYRDGCFYMGDKPTMESMVRRALIKHYTADRRRMRDWIEDVAFMANQLHKRKVEA